MPLPARVQEATVTMATKDTKTDQPQRTQRSRSPRTQSIFFTCVLRDFVSLVTFVAIVLCALVAHVPAQSDITETDLEAASVGRMLRVGSPADGHVIVLPLEVYVSRVLAGEGEPRAAEAAQQALAIAIRTFALKHTARHARDGYDLCDNTHCQVLRPSTPTSRRAAMATVAQVLTYRGELAEVFYSASCGGRSERAADVWPGAEYPYLASRPDDVCEHDPVWTVDFNLRDVQSALARAGFEGSGLKDVRVDGRTASGRVSQLRLSGLHPDVITGDQFRQAVGAVDLRSTAFEIEKRGTRLHFVGHGFGHGVGMCVIGAGRRATRGESARAILAQYYPGLDLIPLSGVASPNDSLTAAAPTPPVTVATGAPIAATPRASGIRALVPASSLVSPPDLERLASRAHDDLSKVLGSSALPMTIRLHDTLDSFRLATNRPWWVSEVAEGSEVDLAPAAVLAQRGGLEASVRMAVAELLVSGPLSGRPEWVRIGAARYFSRGLAASAPASPRVRCPSDAELRLAVSAPAQREAEVRAEACFVRELQKTHEWRAVR